MAGTFSNILLHIVFSTKERQRLITEAIRPRLYDYIGGAVRNAGGVLYEIGGADDHVHMLMRWKTDAAVSDFMRDLKSGTSVWMRETFPEAGDFYWQRAYAVFSVSASQKDTVAAYVRGQEARHREFSFKGELIALLNAHGVEYDERYIWQ